MKKKTIKILGWIILIWAILSPLIFYLMTGLLGQGHGEINSLLDLIREFIINKNFSYLKVTLTSISYFLAPLFFIFSIGLIKLKNWGRKGTLILFCIILLTNIIVLLIDFNGIYTSAWSNININPLSPTKVAFIFSWISSFVKRSIIPIISIILFSQNSTKEVFISNNN